MRKQSKDEGESNFINFSSTPIQYPGLSPSAHGSWTWDMTFYWCSWCINGVVSPDTLSTLGDVFRIVHALRGISKIKSCIFLMLDIYI
jgi:hypothetical protein